MIDMSAKIHKVGQVLDASTSKTEQQAILQLIDEGNSVILDLSTCTYVSSAGLRVILYAYKVAKAKNECIYLVGVCPEVPFFCSSFFLVSCFYAAKVQKYPVGQKFLCS